MRPLEIAIFLFQIYNFCILIFFFRVTKEVVKDSKEAKQFQKAQDKQQTAQKRPGGLNSIMGTITGKAPKMGTLDKSKLDWNKFVDEEGIKEELVTHNKGKDG